MVHADDDIAVPGPGVIAIVLARARGMIRMGMIPADDFESLGDRGFFGVANVFRGDRKTVAGRIVPAIDQGKKRKDFPRGCVRPRLRMVTGNKTGIAAEQSAATFMRIGLRAMSADFSGEMIADPKCGRVSLR